MISLKQEAIKRVMRNVQNIKWIQFNNDAFSFYDDTCGQREHKVEQYIAYGHKVKDHLRVIRKLTFTNKVDEGKEGAILGIIDLGKLTLLSIEEKKVVFTLLTIHFK